MPTLQDVADRAGVTVTTVSRMLNGRVPVSPKTRKKIERAMLDLGYSPNQMARALAKRSSNLVGLIVPSARQYFFAELIQEVEAAVSRFGFQMLLCVSDQELEKEQSYYQALLGDRVRGIIMASYSAEFDQIAHSGAPMVYIERQSVGGIPCVLMDSLQGGRLAGEHLIGRGCRSLLYLSGNAAKNSVSNQRFQGFREACEAEGLPAPVCFEATWEEFISLDYTSSVRRLFAEYPGVDGIFTSNDLMAASVVRYAWHHHISIPDQLKVIGYDDTAFAQMCPLPLTTIHQPIADIADYAMDLLNRLSAGEEVPETTVFPVRLVQRSTT